MTEKATRQLPDGLSGVQAADILGLSPPRLYDALAGRTKTPPRGLEMLVYLWPRLPVDLRAALLAGEHRANTDRSP